VPLEVFASTVVTLPVQHELQELNIERLTSDVAKAPLCLPSQIYFTLAFSLTMKDNAQKNQNG